MSKWHWYRDESENYFKKSGKTINLQFTANYKEHLKGINILKKTNIFENIIINSIFSKY